MVLTAVTAVWVGYIMDCENSDEAEARARSARACE